MAAGFSKFSRPIMPNGSFFGFRLNSRRKLAFFLFFLVIENLLLVQVVSQIFVERDELLRADLGTQIAQQSAALEQCGKQNLAEQPLANSMKPKNLNKPQTKAHSRAQDKTQTKADK